MFKSSNGRIRTKSLFIQFNETSDKSLYSITDEDVTVDGIVYPSLRTIYLSFDDPTDYEFAVSVFGSWEQWERITSNKNLMSYITEWQDEAEIKYRSQAIRSILNTAVTEGSKGVSAAKYIAERGWIKRSAGAPSLEEREGQRNIDKTLDKETKEAMTRMGITVVK